MKPRPTFRQRVRDKRKRLATRSKAYEDARELCSAVGPAAIVREYGFPAGSPAETAKRYAAQCYIDEARSHAERGALDGFNEYLGR